MSYPLIILGAGASFDYSPWGKLTPLTNQLTDEKYVNSSLLRTYRGAGDLLVDVMAIVKKGKTFEQALTEIKNETEKSEQMQRHFVALEFYLKHLFQDLSLIDANGNVVRMHEQNNYQSLLNRVYTYCEGRAVFTTFNYDTLLERNILGMNFNDMSSYVSGKIKIFKLHGSHDWVYVETKEHGESGQTDYDFATKYPNVLENLRNNKNIRPYHEKEIENRTHEYFRFPAIAIPLVGKDSYVCPDAHIQLFTKELSSIDRMLIIGWKGGDPALIQTLKDCGECRHMKVMVVSGGKAEADLIAETLTAELGLFPGVAQGYDGGFTDFVGSDECREFFKS